MITMLVMLMLMLMRMLMVMSIMFRGCEVYRYHCRHRRRAHSLINCVITPNSATTEDTPPQRWTNPVTTGDTLPRDNEFGGAVTSHRKAHNTFEHSLQTARCSQSHSSPKSAAQTSISIIRITRLCTVI